MNTSISRGFTPSSISRGSTVSQYSAKPIYILLIQCLILQCTIVANGDLFLQFGDKVTILSVHFLQGVSYFCYPLIGWLADVRLTRYKMVVCSLLVTGVSAGIATVMSAGILGHIVREESVNHRESILATSLCIFIVVPSIVGLSMFEANAIQFGMDQLLEASSEQLSSFIHWYYWFGELGHFAFGYVVITLGWITGTNSQKFHPADYNYILAYSLTVIFLVCCGVLTAMSTVWATFLCRNKEHFFIQRAGINPIKMAYKVLRYSWKHACPENRSAFTYWEEDVPSRIDLGKNKYGTSFVAFTVSSKRCSP